MIKNIMFDIGGILTRFDPNDYLAPFGFEKEKSEELEKIIFKNNLWNDYMVGKISAEKFKENVINSNKIHAADIKEVLDTKNTKLLLPPLSEGVDFLLKMAQQGFNVYILSNIVQDSLNYFRSAFVDVNKAIKGAIYSCEVGLKKPDTKIYQLILNKYNLNPAETIFIDDSESNIKAAKDLDITGVHCTPLKKENEFQKVISLIRENI